MNPMRIIGEATHTVTPWLDDALYKIDKADGTTITMPKAVGSGFAYTFVMGVTATSDAIIQVANSNDVMTGQAVNTSGDGWDTASDTDTVTLNGGTTGGKQGDIVKLVDIGEGVWLVDAVLKQDSTAARPFSASV